MNVIQDILFLISGAICPQCLLYFQYIKKSRKFRGFPGLITPHKLALFLHVLSFSFSFILFDFYLPRCQSSTTLPHTLSVMRHLPVHSCMCGADVCCSACLQISCSLRCCCCCCTPERKILLEQWGQTSFSGYYCVVFVNHLHTSLRHLNIPQLK